MSRNPVSKRLLGNARLFIDQAQAGDREAQRKLKEMMVKHDQQMPQVLYLLMQESLEAAYPEEPRDCLDAGTDNGCYYQEPHKHGFACDKTCTECKGR